MKKLILGTIVILLSSIIFGMEESNENEFNILTELSKHHPMLEKSIIGKGIKLAIESTRDPIQAIIKAYKYINTITSIDKFWHSKKAELIEMLKDLAKKNEKLVFDYPDLDQKKLNEELSDEMIYLINRAKKIGIESEDIRKEISENKMVLERTKIARLIIAGVDPNFEFTAPLSEPIRPLQLMIELEDVELVLLLIIYGADVNHKNSLGLSPLAIAILGSYPHLDMHKVEKIIKLLMIHGANVYERDKYGENIAINRVFRSKSKQATLLETLLKNGMKLTENDKENDIEEIKEMILLRNKNKPNAYKKIAEVLEKYGYQM